MTEQKVSARSTASELRASLARKLRLDGWVTVTEVQLFDEPVEGAMRRADLVAMKRRGRGPVELRVFELKVARADFLADVRSSKWETYRRAGPVFFAAPERLISLDEVPHGAGLVVHTPQGWSWRRRAPPAIAPEPPLELMRRLVMAAWDQAEAAMRRELEPNRRTTWQASERARTEFGRRVTKVAQDVETAERWLEEVNTERWNLREQIERDRDELYRLRGELRALAVGKIGELYI